MVGNWLPTGNATVAGVIGDPVRHSLSPAIHSYWLQHYAINGLYIPIPIKEAQFEASFRMLPELGIVGANLTIPYKERVIPLLDNVSEEAQSIGAVNTVWFEHGKMHGTNSDGFGFASSIEAGIDGRLADGPALIIGAGGAARAVLHAVKYRLGIREIHLVNRSRGRAEEMVASMGMDGVIIHDFEEMTDVLPEIRSLLVNTTSLGMHGNPPLHIDFSGADKGVVVSDIVYQPLHTPLLEDANAAGLRIVTGIGMLLHQARAGFQQWYGVNPEVTANLEQSILGLAAGSA